MKRFFRRLGCLLGIHDWRTAAHERYCANSFCVKTVEVKKNGKWTKQG